MRLKRLDIQGFKSFAQPVTLEFGGGITAIVGPNGSGKSNISDAIRWVLGEQSIRSLRGQKMEDVIFAGSDGKKPLGMAQVQLTLDNSQGFLPVDYGEVTVARRVFRSGESEFLINRQSCRLRDIQDLFTDTGLGREGYAVIGQGQLEAVLSVRSEDRRVLLEETAGIVKYRRRKEEALRKLQDTDLDLLRVTDILHELESQLGPLSEQAEKARQYLDLASQLREAELDYDHLLWFSLQAKLAQAGQRKKQLVQEYEAQNRESLGLQQKRDDLEQTLQALAKEGEEGKDALFALSEAYNEGLHKIELHRERISNHKKRRGQLADLSGTKAGELAELQGEQDEVAGQLEKLEKDLHGQDLKVSAAAEAAKTLQAEHRQTQGEISAAKDDFFDFMRSLAENRNLQKTYQDRLQSLKAQLEAGGEEVRRLEQELVEIAAQLAQGESLKKEQAQLLQGEEAEEKKLRQRLKEEQEQLALNQQKISRLESRAAELASRRATLEELEGSYQGYAYGVRRLMQDAEMSSLVLGTVAGIITVPQGLEIAYEVALGSALQNVITADQTGAKTLIRWLQAVQGGRVTFLPLDTVRGREFTSRQQEHFKLPGVLGSALDLAEFPGRFRPVLASLLGRVAITEDLDTALLLRERLAGFSRLVTADGSIIFPSGALTGGSWQQKGLGLLSRKAELSELQSGLELLEQERQDLCSQGEELALGLKRTELRLAELQGEQLQSRLAVQSAEQSCSQLSQAQSSSFRRRTEVEENCRELAALLSNLDVRREQAAASVAKLEAEEAQRRGAILEQEKQLGLLSEELERALEIQSGERVRLAELQGVLETFRLRLGNLEERRTAALKAAEEARRELRELEREEGSFQEIIETAQKLNEVNKSRRQTLEAELAELAQERSTAQKLQGALGEQLEQSQKEQLAKERMLYKAELEVEQLEQERSRILAALEERELPLQEILRRSVQVQEAALKRTLARLRNRIKDLGLVNPGAAQEYEAVQGRCEFLQTQLQDLNEARASLQRVISEMDKLCRSKLQGVFREVKAEFQKIFQRLFQGGKAELVMTDPDSVLTTGIEIMAQPPGKKLQNLLLLSGGERALTSIALLFAIRKVKPTPFCVLDEIDAALDQSNLHRFVDLLEEFGRDTQILVITHRPGTMEAAQTLYGVTMGELAISQIISVALN